MRTYVAAGEEAEALKVGANWFVVDATDQVLGRLATRVARVLIGKDKPNFTPYLDSGDHVVVINADKVRLTGNKLEQKVYRTHSGYPGGFKEVPVKRVREKRPLDQMPEVMAAIRQAETELDGNSRINVRYSGTEPLARIMVEAATEGTVQRLAASIAGAIEKALGAGAPTH
jgi:ribosomal protein L13